MELNIFKKGNQEGIPSKSDIRDIIIYACIKNGIVFEQTWEIDIELIVIRYNELCVQFKKGYVIGELDTFKRAACLLVAINECGINNLDKDMLINISIDASFKMSEKPYWFVGYNCNIPYKINEVNFEKMFEEDSYLITGRKMFIDSVKRDYSNYLSFADSLQLWHYVASMRDGIIPGIEMSSSDGYGRILRK